MYYSNHTIVSTAQNVNEEILQEAHRVSELLELPYVERKKVPLERLLTQYNAKESIILKKAGPSLYTGKDFSHSFHLSMAQLRLLAIKRGTLDHLAVAIGEEPLHSFLDCTAGLCSDTLIVSYTHPECEHIIALEGSKTLAYITNHGLRHFIHTDAAVTAALRSIQLLNIRYEDFLKRAKTDSFDVIYFDPMFEVPVVESPQFLALRGHLIETTLTKEILEESLRVAKRKVIVKERTFSKFFKTYKPTRFEGGKYSRIVYGIYDK